ncbi:putative membrane protein YwaF [Paenibacillus polymyxa]|uniref:hypothetical protein n=1 Tax=Paenibacillus polymyxa TaxID=1406 RepID=UPI002791B0CB|nr:hypothetical protein [Paenibacillus polymyxa]MDQ0049520.1 putative membrane protein YwaF [Paenibacillus polymyxa]
MSILGFLLLGGCLLLLSLNTPVDGNYLANALPASILVALGNAFAYLPATTAATLATTFLSRLTHDSNRHSSGMP